MSDNEEDAILDDVVPDIPDTDSDKYIPSSGEEKLTENENEKDEEDENEQNKDKSDDDSTKTKSNKLMELTSLQHVKNIPLLLVIIGTFLLLIVLCLFFFLTTVSVSIAFGVVEGTRDCSKEETKTSNPIPPICPSSTIDPITVNIGILMPGHQYDKHFAGLMLHAATRAVERMKEIHDESNQLYIPHFFPCLDCTYTPQTIIDDVSKMYNDNNTKIFVGPLTSSHCELLGTWSAINAPDTIFISPSATANTLSNYGNIFRLPMSNEVRVKSYSLKLSEYSTINETTKVQYFAKGDISSDEFFTLLNQSASSHSLEILDPIFYPDDSIINETSAIPYLRLLNQSLYQLNEPDTTVILIQSHDEITFILEAADSFPSLLNNYTWILVGMAFNQDLIQSTRSVNNAVQVKLTSIQYIGTSGISSSQPKQQFNLNVRNDYFESTGVMVDAPGILNPTINAVHDSVLLAYKSVLFSSNKIINMSMILKTSEEEFGFTGSLRMTPKKYYRYHGNYAFVSVVNISSDVNWMIIEELFSEPIESQKIMMDSSSNNFLLDNEGKIEYSINEQDNAVVVLSKEYFDDVFFCDMLKIEFYGSDKFGNRKEYNLTQQNSNLLISKFKENGTFVFVLKNQHNFMNVYCNGTGKILEEFMYYKMICPFSFSGNKPQCTFNFFDRNRKMIKYFQYPLLSTEIRSTMYDYNIGFDHWIPNGFGFVIDENQKISGDVLKSKEASKKAIEIVLKRF